MSLPNWFSTDCLFHPLLVPVIVGRGLSLVVNEENDDDDVSMLMEIERIEWVSSFNVDNRSAPQTK